MWVIKYMKNLNIHCAFISYFNIFIHLHEETDIEYFYFRVNYTILINENDTVPYYYH